MNETKPQQSPSMAGDSSPACFTTCPCCGSSVEETQCKARCNKCHALVYNCGGD